jgi:hypothetical protein
MLNNTLSNKYYKDVQLRIDACDMIRRIRQTTLSTCGLFHIKKAYALNSLSHHVMQAAQICIVLHRIQADTVDVILREENVLLLFHSGHGMVLTVNGLSPRKPGFGPKVVFVTFVEDRVSTESGFAPIISGFPCQYHCSNAPRYFVYHRHYIILAVDCVAT